MKRLITPPGMADPNAGAPAPQAAQLNLNPRELDDVQCEKCQNFTFQNVVLMKRISPLQSPSGREAFVPAEVFACAACGHVNDRFIQGMSGWFKGSKVPEAPAPTATAAPTSPIVAAASMDEIVTSDLQTVAIENDQVTDEPTD